MTIHGYKVIIAIIISSLCNRRCAVIVVRAAQYETVATHAVTISLTHQRLSLL
uniref:Uncharacterized protein n=1 Tax=Anguilla anguilla TaxID=7936 RepID=A0A0E9W7V5_ANGAN